MTTTMTRTITCAHLIAGAAHQPATARRIEIAGDDITAVGGADGAMTEPLLALPVLVNAHDHGRAVRSSSIGAAGKPLESWLHHGWILIWLRW